MGQRPQIPRFFQAPNTHFLLSAVTVGVCLLLFAGLGACGRDATLEDTPIPRDPNATYRTITGARLGNGDEGVDLTGDGESDNALETALTAIEDILFPVLREAFILQCQVNECTEEEETQGLAFIDALEASLTYANLQENLTLADDYTLVITESTEGEATCVWHDDTVGDDVSTQVGQVSAEGSGLVGPDTLPLMVKVQVVEDENSSIMLTWDITLRNAHTELVRYPDTDAPDFQAGGAISVEDLLTLAQGVLIVMAQIPELQDLLTTETMDTILTLAEVVLYEGADVDLDGDANTGEGYSVGFVISTVLDAG